MADHLTTQVDRGYLDPATRADASRYLMRTNNADLLEVLGLGVDEPERPGHVVVGGVLRCAKCWGKTRADGVCRRRECGGAR